MGDKKNMFSFIKTKTGLQFSIACFLLITLILFLSTVNYRSINKINDLFNKTLAQVEHKEKLKQLTLQIASLKQNLKYTLTLSETPLIMPLITEITVLENKIIRERKIANADIDTINKIADILHQIKVSLKELKAKQSSTFNTNIKDIYMLFEDAIALIETKISEQETIIKNHLLKRNKIFYSKAISLIITLFLITATLLIVLATSLKKIFYFKKLIVTSINHVAKGKSSINLPQILSEIANSIDIVDASLQTALDVAANERKENEATKQILEQLTKLKEQNSTPVSTTENTDQSINETDKTNKEITDEKTEEENSSPQEFVSMKALIIEDNETSMRLAQTLLYNVNCLVDQAKNGKEALKLISKEIYDIILLDINLPDINGYNVSKIIRQKLQNKTPIVAISSLNDAENIKKALSSGMNDFIHKPLSMRSLRTKLEKLVPAKASLWS